MNCKLLPLLVVCFLVACNPSKQIARSAQKNVLEDSSLRTAHVGISIYEPATGKYWFNYQGDKYFVPASNTKLATCYAAMKYLGDSLVGLEYQLEDNDLLFRGTGDPTLLHPDFKNQKVVTFLQQHSQNLILTEADFTADRWASGWAVGDIDQDYAPERSELPVYGNILRIAKRSDSFYTIPPMPQSGIPSKVTDWRISFERPSLNENIFTTIQTNRNFVSQEIPFVTGKFMTAWVLLMDTLKRNIELKQEPTSIKVWNKIYSQRTDSFLRITMHRSDNFFAEQALLMVSHQRLGVMNDRKIIDTLLKTDYKDLPQKPNWVDGSGLSRNELFTPQDFITILNKIKNEFGMERIKSILATGGEGTIASYYKADKGYIFAKTGTLSGVVALSGYLYTKKNKLLIFSVLVNDHQSSATAVRRAVERFIEGLRGNY